MCAAARALGERSNENGALGIGILNWQRHVAEHWSRLRLGELRVESDGNRHAFHVQAYLDELDPDAIRVELYADPVGGSEPFREVMQRGDLLVGSSNAYSFSASVPDDRPASDFTPRLVPFHQAAAVPLEANQILWYK